MVMYFSCGAGGISHYPDHCERTERSMNWQFQSFRKKTTHTWNWKQCALLPKSRNRCHVWQSRTSLVATRPHLRARKRSRGVAAKCVRSLILLHVFQIGCCQANFDFFVIICGSFDISRVLQCCWYKKQALMVSPLSFGCFFVHWRWSAFQQGWKRNNLSIDRPKCLDHHSSRRVWSRATTTERPACK